MSTMVLITGATGLIGTALTEMLLENGYQVSHLSRSKTAQKTVKSYTWDITSGFIENGALENANIVIHLAGAGVADKRWSEQRKKEILQSRVQTTQLLCKKLQEVNSPCHLFIAASAIGIYGRDTGSDLINEESDPGTWFLSDVTKTWESEIATLSTLKLRLVTLRLGVVLSDRGGALPKIAKSVRLNLGAILGSGKQYMSWIHIDDVCGIFLKALKNPGIVGVFNVVAPNPVTNEKFTRTLASVLNRFIWLPPVPAQALTVMLGEMAQIVLGGNRVSPQKIQSAGYQFRFTELKPALEELLIKKQEV